MIIVSFIHNNSVKATYPLDFEDTNENRSKVETMIENSLVPKPDHWDRFELHGEAPDPLGR